jgi:hypothetical protein
MQFAINADNAGGLYRKEHTRNKYSITCALVPPSEKSSQLLINIGQEWMHEKRHIDWCIKQYKNEEGEYETVYEMCLSLWDKWEDKGPEYSSPTGLYPLKRIRLALVFNDSDAPDDTFTEWSNLASSEWWNDADEIPQFILDMPAKMVFRGKVTL